jgi:hypothetical protein
MCVTAHDCSISSASFIPQDTQAINQNAQPAMLAGQLRLTQYHVTPETDPTMTPLGGDPNQGEWYQSTNQLKLFNSAMGLSKACKSDRSH